MHICLYLDNVKWCLFGSSSSMMVALFVCCIVLSNYAWPVIMCRCLNAISDNGHAVCVPTSAMMYLFASDNFSLCSKQPAAVDVQLVTFWGATQKLFFLLTSEATFCRGLDNI